MPSEEEIITVGFEITTWSNITGQQCQTFCLKDQVEVGNDQDKYYVLEIDLKGVHPRLGNRTASKKYIGDAISKAPAAF